MDTWQSIANNTDRLKVFGGWLVRTRDIYSNTGYAMAFVPDVHNEWPLAGLSK